MLNACNTRKEKEKDIIPALKFSSQISVKPVVIAQI